MQAVAQESATNTFVAIAGLYRKNFATSRFFTKRYQADWLAGTFSQHSVMMPQITQLPITHNNQPANIVDMECDPIPIRRCSLTKDRVCNCTRS